MAGLPSGPVKTGLIVMVTPVILENIAADGAPVMLYGDGTDLLTGLKERPGLLSNRV
jgi:hypothetical protein